MINFFRIFLLFFILSNVSLAQENSVIRIIDINLIINNSLLGKKIVLELESKKKLLENKHKKLETNLQNNKNEILSQQNILEKNIYEQKVIEHQNNVNRYHELKKNDYDEINRYKEKETIELLKKIDLILLDFVQENKIDLIIKKDALIMSNKELDITDIVLNNLNIKYRN